MTLKLFEDEILQFLSSPAPAVLCITGKWGVGKTYAWKHCVRKAQEKGSISLKKISYVSLFGQNSLDEVRTSIVENTIDSNSISLKPSLETLAQLANAASSKMGGFTDVLKKFPLTANYFSAMQRALYLTIKEQIICIDDIERAGVGLDTKNILGIVSYLKEEKSCKVAILLNSDELGGTNKTDFVEQLEKVADTVIEFSPTSRDCADLAIPEATEVSAWVKENTSKLGITNLRVIRRINDVSTRIYQILSEFPRDVKYEALHTAAVAAYAKYLPKEAPPLGLIKDYNSFSRVMRGSKSNDEQEARHMKILQDYNYATTSELDILVIQSIEKGYYDLEALKGSALQLSKEVEKRGKENDFDRAWELFHGGFSTNDDEVLDAIFASIKTCCDAISPLNLNGAVVFLKSFGRADQAKEALDFYVSNRTGSADFWDPEHAFLGTRDVDPAVSEAFHKKYIAHLPVLDTREVLMRIGREDAWGTRDRTHLSNVSPKEYYSVFNAVNGRDFRSLMKGAASFVNLDSEHPEDIKIASAMKEALVQISLEGKMNERRVSRFWPGVKRRIEEL